MRTAYDERAWKSRVLCFTYEEQGEFHLVDFFWIFSRQDDVKKNITEIFLPAMFLQKIK